IRESDGKHVPDSTFFCLDTDRNIFVGAVNIRHFPNERLLRNGGHIGDGIRPGERRKGYGTKMVALALEECDRLGIRDVLMCCDRDNIASARTIIKNGGILENEVADGDTVIQRYRIKRNL
ncbi:MAG: GNAT family N-acetyltransferase, partial [Clostridia bacterium]|nr:GNAT family N-acetyltransferase [Clostridia bacterium]